MPEKGFGEMSRAALQGAVAALAARLPVAEPPEAERKHAADLADALLRRQVVGVDRVHASPSPLRKRASYCSTASRG